LADGSGIWPWIGGGCHCSRDTVAALRGAGFEVLRVRDVEFDPSWMITNPHVLGVASR
jgi:hypothetical protein